MDDKKFLQLRRKIAKHLDDVHTDVLEDLSECVANYVVNNDESGLFDPESPYYQDNVETIHTLVLYGIHQWISDMWIGKERPYDEEHND